MRYWRVTFTEDGKPYTVREIEGPGHDEWIVVSAADEEAARTKAVRLYCSRKKRARVAALHAEGRCACGRPQDGAIVEVGRHKGKPHKMCATCRERMTTRWRPNAQARAENGTAGRGVAERDEGARVALNLQRQRDRRAEIRLETLIEARSEWRSARNFAAWLDREIAELTKTSVAA